MKKIKVWHPIVAILLGLGVSATASYPAIQHIQTERIAEQREIQRLDAELKKAMLKQDTDGLQELLDDDFEMYTVSRGVISKNEWIDDFHKGRVNYKEIQALDEPHIQGKQLSRIFAVSGEFFGVETKSKSVEITIRTIIGKETPKIKCIVVKLV